MISLNTKLREIFSPNSIYAGPIVRRFILGLVFFILFMVILSADFIQEKVSLTVGQVSDRDVISPRTVSYVNKAKTEKLESEVSSSVANVYDLDVSVVANAEDSVSSVFRLAKNVALDKTLVSDEQKQNKLHENLTLSLPQNVIGALSKLNETELAKTEESTRAILRKYLQRGIRDDDLDIARKQIVIETEEMGLSKNSETVVAGIAQTLLKPNFILNVRETEKRKQVALANVEQIRDTVKKGQVLVRRGDVVTLDQIRAIEEVGLYKGQLSELRIFGLSIFVLIGIGLVLGYLYKFANHLYRNDMYLVLMGLILLVILLLGKAAHYYSDFAAPIAAGSLLTAILIDTRLGILISVILALMYGIIIENDLRAVATTLAGCIVGVFSVSKVSHGYSLTKTGVWIAAVNVLIIIATGFIDQVNNMEILIQGLFGIFGGIASAVVTTGLLPYLEHTFKITTPIKLLESMSILKILYFLKLTGV
jgi:membrane-associated HD superfamily phosphohydrolase